jgi:hypothetical protein
MRTKIGVSTADEKSVAWREPMMWLVIGIPAITVVASVWLMVKLSGGPPDDVVRDDVQRVAQIQVGDLAPDEKARQLGLSLLLSVLDEHLELRPTTGAAPKSDDPLRLILAHPLRASEDRELLLQPENGLWQASATVPVDHDWNVTLLGADGSWRLTGRLIRGSNAVLLQPALAAR